MVLKKDLILVLLGIFCFAYGTDIYAQFEPKDMRARPELVVCSQNLENFGNLADSIARDSSMNSQAYKLKIAMLVDRFEKGECDVIAVQEVLGKTEQDALAALNTLASALSKKTTRPFEARVSSAGDGSIRNGFIVGLDRSEILNLIAYSKIELPKLLSTDKPKIFDRAPLEIQLQVKDRDDPETKLVTLLNFHFKSKSGAQDDPTGLQFETVRMQMAEAIRRLIDIRHAETFKDSSRILVVLGDRNTDYEMAAARILDGSLALSDFQIDGPCRLSKRAIPICKTENRRPQKLFSPLTLDPEIKGVAGSYIYKEEGYWIDDILLTQPSLKYANANSLIEGNYDSGTVSIPSKASDHALVYVKLNW